MANNTKKQYDFAFAEELAAMTAQEFQRWNPGWSVDDAQMRINAAKERVSKALGPLFCQEHAPSPALSLVG